MRFGSSDNPIARLPITAKPSVSIPGTMLHTPIVASRIGRSATTTAPSTTQPGDQASAAEIGLLHARGFSYEGKGELDSAVADLRKALALDPQDTRLPDNIKRVERQLASRSSANTSASSSASPPVYASEDDKACAGALQFEAWLPACDRLIASGKLSGSNLAVVYRHRGNWYQLKNDHDRAVADYTEAFRHDPSNALTANSLKMSLRAVCFLSNDAAGKVAACTRFIAVIPETDNDLPAAYLNRADGYKRAGDRARASADINAALRINPNSSAALRA